MTCTHCGAAEQRGRFCVGCGTAVPPSTRPTPRRRYALNDELTQPVLRLERPSKPAVPTR
ncbi:MULTISPECIES: hypothetical protein [unclassified Geodermatophilus]|uniref:hypothetical protein n=1 Tax=unclassified Geodermatophilus TaxID=2637632 RepID=UPI003EF01007